VNEAKLVDVLDEYMGPFDAEPEEWDDAVRRARRRLRRRRLPSRKLALLIVVVGAALAGGPALGVLLLRNGAPQLPAAADKSRAVAALNPRTGKVIVIAAPWKGHDGVCILFLGRSAGCWYRRARGTMALISASAEWGYTFDRRATAAVVLLLSGKRVPITFRRFPSLGIAVFASAQPIRGDVQAIEVSGPGGRPLYPPSLDIPVHSK
jgi:hypothetical protein